MESITPKVKWKREESGTCVPYMFEEINSIWAWRRYNVSKVNTPNKFGSEGIASFMKALKLGYIVEQADLHI
jgi:hypothetical protein